jgi:hypothetical protein
LQRRCIRRRAPLGERGRDEELGDEELASGNALCEARAPPRRRAELHRLARPVEHDRKRERRVRAARSAAERRDAAAAAAARGAEVGLGKARGVCVAPQRLGRRRDQRGRRPLRQGAADHGQALVTVMATG